jgi:hypothetical protein
MAAPSTPKLPVRGKAMRAGVAVNIKIAPAPFWTMCRAAARAVRKFAATRSLTGRLMSSGDYSRSGVP